MNNGWTGGQYSLFRAILGICLVIHFVCHFIQDVETNPNPQTVVLFLAAVILSILFAIGLYDRLAALLLLPVYFCTGWFGSTPLCNDLSQGPVSLLLANHLLLPPAPYGSWAARGRLDPGGSWNAGNLWDMSPWFFIVSLVFVAGCLGYCISLGLPDWFGGFDLCYGLLLLLLSMFNPAWIAPKKAGTEMIFYDGGCGLCHRSVRFVLAEDRAGDAFRFAPLQSDTFQTMIPAEERAKLPDSLIVRTESGQLLMRSQGILYIMARLGGVWRLLAGLAGLVPLAVRDAVYSGIARIRHRLFQKPPDVCPILPPALRQRFDH